MQLHTTEAPQPSELYDEISVALRDGIHHSTTNHELRDADVPTIHNPLIDAIQAGDASSARAETIAYLERHMAAHQTTAHGDDGR